MKVGLLGFGKTGKAVASVLLEHNDFCLEWIYRKSSQLAHRSAAEFLDIHVQDPSEIVSSEQISIEQLLQEKPVDILIDFSSSEAIHLYGDIAARKGIIIISAISHYTKQEISCIKKLGKLTKIFWSPNITFGVNYILFAAKFLKKINPYVDIEIVEEHFKGKKGISGTAQKMAEVLDLEDHKVNSIRVGGIVGKHEVIFGFPYQTIRFVHESISREAFGNGVIFAAKNLLTKPKGYYKYEDLLQEYFVQK